VSNNWQLVTSTPFVNFTATRAIAAKPFRLVSVRAHPAQLKQNLLKIRFLL
jgi:hypothetical protein